MATEQLYASAMNQQRNVLNGSMELYNQALKLWWDGFVAMTRYSTRVVTSAYEITFRPYPTNVNQALEAIYRDNLDRAKSLQEVITNEAQTARDTAVSLSDQFLEKGREVQQATTDAVRREAQQATQATQQAMNGGGRSANAPPQTPESAERTLAANKERAVR
jgi:hypothetical protein